MSDLAERGAVFAVHDRFPVTAGHLLILPQRHTPDWFSMTARERSDAAPKTGTRRKPGQIYLTIIREK